MRNLQPTILLAEDNGDDVLILKWVLKQARLAAKLAVVENGQQAIDYLSGHDPFSDRAAYPLPSLIILDLKMPIKTGFDVLAWLGKTESTRAIPAFVLSSSGEQCDVDKALQLGAAACMVKPPTPQKLLEIFNSVLARGMSLTNQ